jgi:hypothetical protein
VLGAGLVLWFLLPYVLGGFRFPLGPDAPVYLWWMRLAGHDGLSAVGHRPGVPALALSISGTLRLSEVQTIAALECVLGTCVGLASAVLVRASRAGRAAWALAGLLAGTFGVHLAAGYIANLAFAAAFLAAAAVLARGDRRGAVAAAALLAAGGLAHPLFFLLGAGILLLSAAFAWRPDRAEAMRVGGAVLGGGALLGVGLLALLAGPGPLDVDTSKDGFLRRAGLTAELRSAYVDRLRHRWTRYVQWASLPLAVVGLRQAGGFVGRFLRAWGVVLVAGVVVSLATALAPADRFITFGFVVPILAALGLVRLWGWLARRRWLAVLITGTLSIAMLAGAWIAWGRQEPFMSELEVARATAANGSVALTGSGTALVFLVNDADPSLAFLATRAANVIRATVPPDRIRDVVILVPPAPEATDPVRDALSVVTAGDVTAAGEPSVTVLLAPFDRVDLASASDAQRVARGVFMDPAYRGADQPVRPLDPSSPAGIAWGTVLTFALLVLAGYGWARAATPDAFDAGVLAPVFGMGAITIAAIILERVGVPLSGARGPVAVSLLAGGGGYVMWLILERRARTRPAPQIQE